MKATRHTAVCAITLLGACLDAPSSTFQAATPALRTWSAPQPKAYARFGEKVALAGDHVAMTAPFEVAEDTDPSSDPAAEAAPSARGAAYLVDTADPHAEPRILIPPNADPGDGEISLPLLRVSNGAIPTILAGMSIALNPSFLALGVAGEDGGRTPDTDPTEAERDNSAKEAGAAYIYRVDDPESAPQYLKAPNLESGDLFGESVALGESWLAIGAPAEDSADPLDPHNNDAQQSGAVYMFELRDGQFEFRQYIKAPTPLDAQLFGAALALDGDVLVVGAPGDSSASTGVGGDASDVSAALDGAAHVFRLEAGHWQYERYLKPGLTRTPSAFGGSVRVVGDHIAVGAPAAANCPGEPLGIEWRGVVYTFTRSEGDWQAEQCLHPRGTRHDDLFGVSLGMAQDALLVGAGWDASAALGDANDQSRAFAGAVYLYQRTPQGWQQSAFVKEPNVASNDTFGGSVDLAGSRAAIGASQTSQPGRPYVGSAYLFDMSAVLRAP